MPIASTINLRKADEARVMYLRWLRRASPPAFAAAMNTLRGNSDQLGFDWGGLVNALTSAGQVIIQKKAADKQASLQKQSMELEAAQRLQETLLTVNTQRAQAGLPPVDANGQVIPGSALPAPTSTLSQVANAIGIPGNSPALAGGYLPWLLGGAGVLALLAFWKR